jgi:hypothetical protein
MPITTSELAERTGHDAADKKFLERLQYWTRERLLLPIGKRHPGTGRRRHFHESAVGHARLLNAMMNRVPLEVQHMAMGNVRQEQLLGQKVKSGADFWLVIETLAGHSHLYFTDDLKKELSSGRIVDDIHAFNLTRLFVETIISEPNTGEKNG